MSLLFSPFKLGSLPLSHRVVMAPLTRSRSVLPGDVPGDLMLDYYTQRASAGGLIIAEGATVSRSARGWLGAPGMFSDEQVAGWRRIVDAVHAKGGHMFAQLWHTGRSSHVSVTEGPSPVSASVIPAYWLDPSHLTSTAVGWVQPSPHRALETDEIPAIVEDYRQAAIRAQAAGFDGVELHSANGYLIDQFLQDGSNHRTDKYGGSIENRARLLLEVVEALVSVWGKQRVAVRIGPSGRWNAMSDSNPGALFDYVAGQLNSFDLAYLHIVEPRVAGNIVTEEGQGPVAAERLRKIFSGPIMAAGGFEGDTAEAIISAGNADMVAFGRHFISNPDLPARLKNGWPLAPYDRDTFYTFDAEGYSDYPAYRAGADAHADAELEKRNKALVLEAFDTLFNRRDLDGAAKFWSQDYVQHSAHIAPGRSGLFDLVKSAPAELRYEHHLIAAAGDYVIVHGRFSGNGRPRAWVAADVLRIENGLLIEHWDVLQDEVTAAESLSGRPMFGTAFAADEPSPPAELAA